MDRLTVQTRIWQSVYPVKRVPPSADHCREVQKGGTDFLPTGGNSGLSSSTMDLDSRSQILTQDCVAAQSQ